MIFLLDFLDPVSYTHLGSAVQPGAGRPGNCHALLHGRFRAAHRGGHVGRRACGAGPVSYTHLDVYKRQLLSRGGIRHQGNNVRHGCHGHQVQIKFQVKGFQFPLLQEGMRQLEDYALSLIHI